MNACMITLVGQISLSIAIARAIHTYIGGVYTICRVSSYLSTNVLGQAKLIHKFPRGPTDRIYRLTKQLNLTSNLNLLFC